MFHVSFPGLGINDLPINRVAFSIGSFNVYWYGILIATGLLLAVLYAYLNARRYDVDRNKLIDCVIVGIVTSIIGARAYYVIFKWDYFSAHPSEIIDIRDGGIAIYGAIIGALMCLSVSPLKAVAFLVFIFCLQQFEDNLIYPRVVGTSLGLPGIWVLAAVTVGGGIGGLAGMILSVPVAATIYQLIRLDLQRRESQEKQALTAADMVGKLKQEQET